MASMIACAPAWATLCRISIGGSPGSTSASRPLSDAATSCASISLISWKPLKPRLWAQRTTVAVETPAVCAAWLTVR